MNALKTFPVAVIALLAASSMALAQTPAPVTGGKGCTAQERSNKSLEGDQSNAGVICPPDIDAGMKAPTPKTGDSSVIPPPGTPGGDANVQPK